MIKPNITAAKAVDREFAAALVKQLKAIVTSDEYSACQHRADERDYEKVRLELAANMLRDGGAKGRDALLAGRLTKREAVLWMRDWGLGSGALVRLGLKGKNPASVANAKTVEEIAKQLECFIQHEAPKIPALADLLSPAQRSGPVRLGAVSTGVGLLVLCGWGLCLRVWVKIMGLIIIRSD